MSADLKPNRFTELARTLSIEEAQRIGRVFQAKGIAAKDAEFKKLTEKEQDLFIAIVEAMTADREEAQKRAAERGASDEA